MQLQNPFPFEVRKLYLDCWTCWICGANGQQRGGLEIHHITGRDSDSAFNSSCLCHYCHEKVLHTQEVESMLFLKTLKYLKGIEYVPIQKDLDFLREHYQRLVTPDLEKWLNQKKS